MRYEIGRFRRPMRRSTEGQLVGLVDLGDGSTLSLDFTAMSGLDSRFTFSRASNATFINSSGLVQYADHNLATNTVFANTGTDVPTSWTRPSGTGTSGSNGTFVDGNEEWTQTAALTERPYLSQGITIAIGLTYTCSVYVASAPSGIEARNIIWPVITAGSSQYYQDGVAITSTTAITPGRISVVFTPTSGSSVNVRVGLGCTNGNADTVGTAVFSRPMLIVGDAVSKPYLASNPGPYQAPRFDHDPSTLAPRGLLLESSTTNLLEYSETFDTALWTTSNVQRSTTDSTTAPDGTTVYAIETTSGTAARVLYRNAGAVTGTSVTFSYWFKPGNVTDAENTSTNQSAGRVFAIYKTNPSTTALFQVRIDGQDPTAYAVTVGSGTYDTVAYPNGWYRCRLTTTITTGDSIRAYLGSIGNSTVDSLYWYVWGAQLEAGSGASSYIPTGAGTVQRAADVCYMTPIASWFNNTEGTLLYEAAIVFPAANFNRIIGFVQQTATPLALNPDSLSVGMQGSTGLNFMNVRESSTDRVSTYLPAGGAITSGIFHKLAYAFKQSDYRISRGGFAATNSYSGAFPSGLVTLGFNNIGPGWPSVWFKSVKYFPTRLPDAQMDAWSA